MITHETARAGRPCEGSLSYAWAPQQNECALGFTEFDRLLLDPMLSGCRRGSLPGVALVDIGQIDSLTGGALHSSGRLSHLGSVIDRGGVT